MVVYLIFAIVIGLVFLYVIEKYKEWALVVVLISSLGLVLTLTIEEGLPLKKETVLKVQIIKGGENAK